MGLPRAAAQKLQLRASGGNRVIFVHVPKCGGTSVREALESAFTLRGFGAATLDPVASKIAAEAIGEDPFDLRERWVLYEAARRRHSLIMGHFPGSSVLRKLADDYVIVTLLREPTAQLLSEFYFNRDKTGRHFSLDQETTLKEFLRSPLAREIGSRYVTVYTDPGLRPTPADPAAVEAARATLASFDVVGVLEDLDGFSDRLEQRTGRPLKVPRRNESPTPQGERDADLDDEARELLAEACRPNVTMYEFARSLS